MRTMVFMRSFPFSSTREQRSFATRGVRYTLPPQYGLVTNLWKAPSDTRDFSSGHRVIPSCPHNHETIEATEITPSRRWPQAA
jgi:hypothetical protein